MTPNQLASIRQRFERATSGPWVGDRLDGTVKYEIKQDGCECDRSPECPHLVLKVDHKNGEFGFLGERGEEDAEFVMQARTDVPLLTDALERTYRLLAKALDRQEPTCSLEELVDTVAGTMERLVSENRCLKGSVESLLAEQSAG